MLSVTFDDVPASACRAGRSVLEKFGCAGTYYVCGGLTGTGEGHGRMHEIDDLKSLLAGGHEIGSHGYAHVNYQQLSRAQIESDLDANAEFLEQLGADPAIVSFAYPFGCVSAAAKRIVGERFSSSRGVVGGAHFGSIDVALLRALPLYEREFDASKLARELTRTAERSGWLILLTHDVRDDPGGVGCRPSTLEFALRSARELGLSLLPVKHAIGRAAFRSAN